MSVVGLKSLDVNPCNELLLLRMIIKILWPENTSSHISRHLEFIIERSLGLRVAGFPGPWIAGSQNVTQFHLWFTAPGTEAVKFVPPLHPTPHFFLGVTRPKSKMLCSGVS